MALIPGTNGDDILVGTVIPRPGDSINDQILGFGGDDDLSGGTGDDVLIGADGADTLDGGLGDDQLFGDEGVDAISGGDGADVIFGGLGDDDMSGGDGDDVLVWTNGDGSDQMNGGADNDRVEVNGSLTDGDQFEITAGANGAALFSRVNLGLFTLTLTEVETNRVIGGGGDDSYVVGDLSTTELLAVEMFGGDGDDSLDGALTDTPLLFEGEAGNDSAIGGGGDDILIGGRGDDVLDGGDGDDSFVWNNFDGFDQVDGGDGVDTQTFNLSGGGFGDEIVFAGTTSGEAILSRVNFGQFDVTMTDVENVFIQSRTGDDTLTIDNVQAGGVARITFAASAGDDVLIVAPGTTAAVTALGGTGDDDLTGGDAGDVLVGHVGDDTLSGGGGRDRLLGQAGDDIMTGGADRDSFVFLPGDGDDTIVDFEVNFDVLRFNQANFSFGDLAFADDGADQVIETPNGDTITLLGLAGVAIDPGDFVIAAI